MITYATEQMAHLAMSTITRELVAEGRIDMYRTGGTDAFPKFIFVASELPVGCPHRPEGQPLGTEEALAEMDKLIHRYLN